jgi:glycerophosphoryl diester phosphodiesterase
MNRAIFLGSGAIVILLVSFGTMNDNTGKRDDTVWNQYPVAHALGSVDGIAYTNSLEAFDTNYKLGQRVFEADFCVTSDHKMVLRHEWDSDYQKGIDANNIPTEEEFTAVPILGSYTPLTLKDLLLLMQKYTDIYLITDTKDSEKALVQEEFEILLNTAKETGTEDVLNRIIVQIYDNEMLDTINEIYEFPIYIYTMYQIWGGDIPEFVEFCKFCRANDISYITMFHFLVNPEVLEIAKAFDIDIYVHTVNDLEQAKNLLNSGVHGIYTDDITLDMLKED